MPKLVQSLLTDFILLYLLVHFFPAFKSYNNPFSFLADILQGNFKPDYYLKHIQKDLRLAICMGDMANHPTPMAAAANEV